VKSNRRYKWHAEGSTIRRQDPPAHGDGAVELLVDEEESREAEQIALPPDCSLDRSLDQRLTSGGTTYILLFLMTFITSASTAPTPP